MTVSAIRIEKMCLLFRFNAIPKCITAKVVVVKYEVVLKLLGKAGVPGLHYVLLDLNLVSKIIANSTIRK